MKTYIAQLENHDDVISVQDKISWSKANRVLLVWPRRGRILERRVDLLLLLRHSQKLGTQLAFVTRSPRIKTLAKELGIPIFRSAEQAQRMAWRRPRVTRSLHLPGDRQPVKVETFRAQLESLSGMKPENRWLSMGMFTLGVFSFLVLALFFAPGAQVKLKPAQKLQQLDINVWTNPEIQAPNPSGGLPAHVLNAVVEGRDQVTSTSVMLVPDGFATGWVQLKNLTNQAVDVPAGSVVLSLNQPPVRFTVTQPVRVDPGPGKTHLADIRAEAPGSSGNLGAGQIKAMEGPAGLNLAVENIEATSGGTDRSSPAPAESDYQNLRNQLLIKLQGNALVEMKGKIAAGQRILAGTLRRGAVIEETRAPAQGQPGDRLELSMRVEFEVWTVNETDLQAVAQAALNANRLAGFKPVPGSMKITFASEPQFVKQTSGGAQNNSLISTTAHWKIHAQRTMETSWANVELINALRGRTVSEARQILQTRLVLAEPPSITLYPTFWWRMPYLPVRITLIKQ